MTHDWSVIEEVFHAAIELPVAGRARFLEERCPDAALRSEVEDLLRSHEEAEASQAFLESPQGEPSPVAAGTALAVGATVGGFRVERLIASGGMGTVYEATQASPHRTVALKVMRSGLLSAPAIRRFEYEAEVLARLRHPAIAQVHESGTREVAGGELPWFAMELIPGARPITEHVRAGGLDIPRRLALFVEVCDAIHHGHVSGVIHRDLKPGNVLVDENGRPKVIDFGVARVTAADVQLTTMQTQAGELVGTLAYMSPEQCAGTPEEIDARADVYGLGMLLYEMLTGQLPYRLAGLALPDAVRVIQGQAPKRPSAVESALTEDVDAILYKALEKDPRRRYQSAAALAEDVRRYLADEPITARPPSLTYHVRLFARRNRALVGALLAIFVMALVAAGVSGYFAIEASSRADETDAALGKARDNLAKFNLVANVVKLREAIAAEKLLYPTTPEHADAIEKWLIEEGRPLAALLPRLTEQRDALRARALPRTERERQLDREAHPEYVQWVTEEEHWRRHQPGHPMKETHERSYDEATLAKHMDALEKLLTGLRERVLARRTYRFEDKNEQFLHETLTQLLTDLSGLAEPESGLLARTEQRLVWARTVRQQTIDGHGEAWDRARREVAASERYGGLELKPQLGLVPLGENAQGFQEFAHPASGSGAKAVAKRGEDGALVLESHSGLVFVLIPAGKFLMGAQKTDPIAPGYDDEALDFSSPPHEVELDAFFLSKYEVTQAQWYRMSHGERPAYYWPGLYRPGEQPYTWLNPVEQVDFHACTRVLREQGLLLPTEAQWEYACRAGTTTKWPTGDQPSSLQGYTNLADRYAKRYRRAWRYERKLMDGWISHAPVGTFRPNAFGLHDMLGNVCEWTRDFFRNYNEPVAPGDGLRAGIKSSYIVVRGGAYPTTAYEARPVHRRRYEPAHRTNMTGLRPARVLTR